MPPRTAFIHIGLPKTGTTAVQAAFLNARVALRAEGFHYLSGDRNHGERLCLAFWDKPDALRLAGLRWKDGEAAEAHRTDVQSALANEIDQAEHANLILSAEDLSTFRVSEVKRLGRFLERRFDRVHVVTYLRDPLEWITSAAQQAVKWSGDLLEDLFDRPRLPEFAERIEPWQRMFGKDAVLLRVYGEREVVRDISEIVGLSAPLPPGPRLNEALSHRSVIALSHVNSVRPPFVDARHNPFRSFSLVRDCRLPGDRFTLPRETVEAYAVLLEEERAWAHQNLGRAVFAPPVLSDIGRDRWFADEREEMETFTTQFMETSRAAQNERAMRMYLTACEQRDDPTRAAALLEQAWLLTTDRWTLDRIAREAVKQDRGDREKFFAKGRLMRRIEAPETGDQPLVIGNPFDRPWQQLTGKGGRIQPAA